MIWPVVIEGIVTIIALVGLIYYRLKKKHKDDRRRKMGVWEGLYNLIDKNIVEFTLFAVLIPDWKLILELLK